MGGNTGSARQALAIDSGVNDLAPNSDPGQYGIHNDIVSLGHLANWQRCFLNVVTETVYDINRNYFVSEKIYKPIIGCRPFLVYDPDGGRQWLEDRGFETYINDFNDITDLDLVIPGNMAPFLKALSQQHQSYFRKKFVDLKEKILYNKNQFRVLVDNNKNLTQKGIACPT